MDKFGNLLGEDRNYDTDAKFDDIIVLLIIGQICWEEVHQQHQTIQYSIVSLCWKKSLSLFIIHLIIHDFNRYFQSGRS